MFLSLFLFGFQSAQALPSHEEILIKAGTFQMGSKTGGGDEIPVHKVELTRDFFIAKNEVTQELYQQVMGVNPSKHTSCGASCPVEQVNWIDAILFLNKFSEKSGFEPCYVVEEIVQEKGAVVQSPMKVTWTKQQNCNGYRLPTEAEWEYAARGGIVLTFAGSNSLEDVGWYSKNSERTTHPVCQKSPNAYGICDMSGNVYEWCWDWYDDTFYANQEAGKDPIGPEQGVFRVIRGGSWYDSSWGGRVTRRRDAAVDYRNLGIGIRTVRTAP